MNGYKTLLAGAVTCALCSPAMADGLYFGANYSTFEYQDTDITNSTFEPDGVTLRIGIEPVDWLGLEIRGATGLNEDTRRILGVNTDFELDHLYGAYAKLGLPISDVVMPYVIGGKSEIKGTAKAVGFEESDSVRDTSYGGGVDSNVSESLGLNVEYMQYLDKDSQELTAWNFGLRTAF
jgi:opacity protein-like surface antigen